jgi:hypothetical protein
MLECLGGVGGGGMAGMGLLLDVDLDGELVEGF